MKKILNEITPLREYECLYIDERHKAEFTYPLHTHNECELNFIEHGKGLRRIIGNSVEVVGECDLALICGPLEHVWEQGECTNADVHEITVQFAADILPETLLSRHEFNSIKRMLSRAGCGLVFPAAAIDKVGPMIKSLVEEKQNFYRILKLLSILYELSFYTDARVLSSTTFSKNSPSIQSRRINRVKEYVDTHYTKEIRLPDVAAIANMSPIAFSRFFKAQTGSRFSDYVIGLRIGAAARMLVDSTKAISEICYECGFNNISNFNRMFKKRHGVTPKKFRDFYQKAKVIC